MLSPQQNSQMTEEAQENEYCNPCHDPIPRALTRWDGHRLRMHFFQDGVAHGDKRSGHGALTSVPSVAKDLSFKYSVALRVQFDGALAL